MRYSTVSHIQAVPEVRTCLVLQVLFLGPLMQLAMDCPWSFMDGIRVAFGEFLYATSAISS